MLDNWRRRLGEFIAGKPVAVRRFEAARQSRLNFGWGTQSAAINADLRMDLPALVARSRDLFQNNDYAKKFGKMVGDNVVGPVGFRFSSLAAKPDGTLDDADSGAIESALAEWMQVGECETSGQQSFADFCRMVIIGVARDGEAIIRRVRDRKYKFGYRLQALDIDRLDTRYNDTLKNGNRVIMSVEIDKTSRPVAYWLLTRHPGDPTPGNTDKDERERVPASDIFHLFVKERPEQVRGFPWMHTAMARLQMLAGYEEASLVAARVGASKMGFFVSPDGTGAGIGDEKDETGDFITDAEAGAFQTLPQGYDFKAWSPDYPVQNYDAYIKACLRGIASGMGVCYNGLGNDLEGVNFSSIRAGTLEERDGWMVVQGWLIGVFLRPMFAEWLEMALLKGAIIGAGGVSLPAGKLFKFAAHSWQGRRWDWVDPEKDINAKIQAIQNNLTDPYTVASQAGVDLEDVLARLAQANKLAAKYGLPAFGQQPPAAQKGPAP